MELKKSKPRRLKPSIKRLIYYRARKDKDIPREYLAQELIKEIEEMGEIPPSFETTKRLISHARNIRDPLDKIWNIGCCSEYPQYFTPESIAVLMDYKHKFQELLKDDAEAFHELLGQYPSDFSMRDAIWIIRLKPLIEKTFADLMNQYEDVRWSYPILIGFMYSSAEYSSEILGEKHFDSSSMDLALATGNLHIMAKAAGLYLAASSKTTKCKEQCDSCKYVKLPGFNDVCMSRRKEDEQCEDQ